MTIIEKLEETIKDINTNFSGTYLNRIQQLSEHDFLFTFSRQKNKNLLISINLLNPFIKLVDDKFIENVNTPFFQRIKTKLINALFKGAKLVNSDNILQLEFIKTTDAYDKIPYSLIIELFKSNTNIIILNKDKIIDAFRYRSLDTKHPILNNMIYECPTNNGLHKEFTENDQKKINEYYLSISERYLNEKYSSIISLLKRKRKTLIKKIETLKQEQTIAENNSCYKDYGDYIKMHFSEIKRGDTKFEVDGITIPLNERLSTAQNLQFFYKQYKKSLLTVESAKKYINETENLVSYIENILATHEFYNESEYELMIRQLSENKIIKTKVNKNNKKIKDASIPYYIVYNNTRIGFGKNSIQNNELTFSIASKNDYFLHINKTHGSHIIIFDSNPSDEVIQFSCELAIFLSKNEDGDVIFTKVSSIKKTQIIGQVRLGKYETYHINKVRENIKEYLYKINRF